MKGEKVLTIRIPRLRAENFFEIFLVLFWGQDILFSYVRAVILRIPYIKYTADYILPMCMGICLLLALPYITQAVSRRDLLFAAGILVLFLIHFVFYPETVETLMPIARVFFTSVFPLYFIGLRFEADQHLRLLYILSVINIWAFSFYTLASGEAVVANQAAKDSYMYRAYLLLPQLMIVVGYLFREGGILNMATAADGFIFLMMCGNRGSVFLFMLFIVAYILLLSERKRRGSVYMMVVMICFGITYFFEQIVHILTILFLRLGMSTRILERLMAGSFFESNGRRIITERLWAAVVRKPATGYGLASDRLYSSSYAHNYALELWMAFGMVVGTILVAITVFLIARAIIRTKAPSSRLFLLILTAVGFLKLFISSSFLQEGLFFMLLGTCVTQLRAPMRDPKKEMGGFSEAED